jgi:hypothetical protein
MNQPGVIGLIAGEGQFPLLVAQGILQSGNALAAIAYQGHTKDEIKLLTTEIKWIKLGQLNKLISYFKKKGVLEVVFAGGINKPKALELRPDFRAARLLIQTRCKSDNSLMQALMQTIECEGMQIVSPLNFVPWLKTPSGVLTQKKLNRKEIEDINFGWPLAKQIGKMDIGQCIVVKDCMVVAVESIEGTNASIKRAGGLVGSGCTVIKIFKPGQLETIDQPSVGYETVQKLKEIKALCLAVEADKSLFFDQEEAIALANKHDISIIGITDDSLPLS